nr:26S proteasome non-ATPase regulatory subunit 2 homolog A-like [Ipomoea trifida]
MDPLPSPLPRGVASRRTCLLHQSLISGKTGDDGVVLFHALTAAVKCRLVVAGEGNQSFDLNHTSATHSQPGIIDDEYPTNFETCTTIQKEDITQIDVPSSPIVIEATHDQQPTASASPSSLETTSSTPTAVDIPAPRRSQRERRQPAHLADFQVDLPQSFDKSSKSPTSNMAAIISLGLTGAGTNNARIAGMLCNLSSYYYKEPDLLFCVRMLFHFLWTTL